MSFHDLMAFNQALLGKQVRGMVYKPNSLVAHIFKARYFLEKTIWEADEGANGSFVWKSLLWGWNLVAARTR